MSVEDHLQQTTLIAQRRSQKMPSDKSNSPTKGNAAYEAMDALTHARERQQVARRLHEHMCQEAAEAETMFSTIKDTLKKAEALEKHVKTVTMRAESWATTEAHFFKTLLDRQEEAQNS